MIESKQLPTPVTDEDRNLRGHACEDVRLLTNFGTYAEQHQRLLLFGLSELHRCLSMAMHESLAQHLIVCQHVTDLERDELVPNLSHRLAGPSAKTT